jgi:glyceraldehyde 3-phosphate dehydrogenase
MLKIGINGFGRIGRHTLRASLERNDMVVVATNDLNSNDRRAHLLKRDSVHGTLPYPLVKNANGFTVNGREVRHLSEKEPTKLPWKDLGVDLVLECTGRFRERSQVAVHMAAGAKRVILSAPGKGEPPDATIVMGVNHDIYDAKKHFVLSNASCTTNCLAPVLKALHEGVGIERAMMTTIHSYTSDQSLMDNDHTDLRRARAAALSMIPTSTGASEAVAQVYPALKGRVDGTSVRVPTPDVSLVDLTVEVSKDVTEKDVNDVFIAAAANGPLKGILAVESEELVSIDYVHNPHSAIVDLPLTQMLGKRWVKVMAWYDNEWGFSNRMLDLAALVAKAGV